MSRKKIKKNVLALLGSTLFVSMGYCSDKSASGTNQSQDSVKSIEPLLPLQSTVPVVAPRRFERAALQPITPVVPLPPREPVQPRPARSKPVKQEYAPELVEVCFSGVERADGFVESTSELGT